MPEPTSSAVATLASGAIALPVLSLFGISLGLRADLLLAGFGGSVAAMALLNTVPGSGDTWAELLRTSLRRIGVSVGSAVTAGYLAPLLNLINGVPSELLQSMAFVAGAGAMQMLPWVIERFGRGQGRTPPPPPADRGLGDDDDPPGPGGWSGLRQGGGQ